MLDWLSTAQPRSLASQTGEQVDEAPNPLYLRRREERRIRKGHPWLFSNEVDTARSPLDAFEAGDLAHVRSHADQFLGVGYVNPNTLICGRLLGRDRGLRFDRNLVATRLERALALREHLFASGFYRLVFGESDGLPGLVVDRYRDVVVAQLATAGMERRRGLVIDAIRHQLAPRAIVLRNDGVHRATEGLEEYVETAWGSLDEPISVEEGAARFRVWPTTGQKTGWYFDQRDNRTKLERYVSGARMLDVFSYCGAFGIRAAMAGAETVRCIDSSGTATEAVRENARLNGVSDRVEVLRADAFSAMKAMHADGERFDVVVVDPPAFIRRRRDAAAGLEAYRRLNRLAVQLVRDGGILLTASCSSHLRRDQLRDVVRSATQKGGGQAQLLEEGHQAPDHPIHPAMPESEYLKAFFVRVLHDR